MKTLALLIALSMTGCAVMPDSTRLELEHVSHPLAGWPVSANNTEDGLTQVNVIGHWQSGRVYVETRPWLQLAGRRTAGLLRSRPHLHRPHRCVALESVTALRAWAARA
jgi:hypothetical protein